ncbi:MAG: hypothetical protein U0Y68_06910 [Blastocatellia bacterium]
MTNTEMQILDFSRCWIFDRYVANDAPKVAPRQEIAFDWFDSHGTYQDFEALNQLLPGYGALAFRFVVTHREIYC